MNQSWELVHTSSLLEVRASKKHNHSSYESKLRIWFTHLVSRKWEHPKKQKFIIWIKVENLVYPSRLSEVRASKKTQTFIIWIKVENLAYPSSLSEVRASKKTKRFIIWIKVENLVHTSSLSEVRASKKTQIHHLNQSWESGSHI